MATFPELASRVVAITGSAQGIGAETARHFAGQGAAVALLDIDHKNAQVVADAIIAAGGRATVVPVDVTDETSVNAAVAATVAAYGGIDVLITCASGYTRLAQVEDMPLDEWERTIALNLRSAFLCSKAVIPHLKKSKAGRIIHVASISGRTVHASSSPAYGAAKAAVIQLTRFLAWELGPSGITANAVAPITTLTPRVAALRSHLATVAPVRSRPRGIPLGIGALGGLHWPRPGLSEVSGMPGSGRLGLVLPAMAALTQAGQEIALIDVLGQLYPPGLSGVRLDQVLLVRPGRSQVAWAAEQIARSGVCPLVVLIDPPRLGPGARRLQHAAEAGGVSLIVVSERPDPGLPATLRLATPRSGQVLLSKDGRGARERVVELTGASRPLLLSSRLRAQPPESAGSIQPDEGIEVVDSGA